MPTQEEHTQPAEVPETQFITADDVCRRFAVSRRFLSELQRTNAIPFYRLSHKCVRFDSREIEEFFREHLVPTRKPRVIRKPGGSQ